MAGKKELSLPIHQTISVYRWYGNRPLLIIFRETGLLLTVSEFGNSLLGFGAHLYVTVRLPCAITHHGDIIKDSNVPNFKVQWPYQTMATEQQRDLDQQRRDRSRSRDRTDDEDEGS